MTRKCASSAVLVFSLVFGFGCSKNSGDDGLKEFQGKWQLVMQEEKGKKPDLDSIKKTTMLVQKDKVQMIREGTVVNEIVIRVQAEKSPAEIDFVLLDGPEQGKTEKGIFVFDGNKLKICIAEADKPRPTEFAAKDSAWTVLVLQRAD